MTKYCDATVDQFLENIKMEFETKHLGEGCSIVTPFYYPDFAAIELHIHQVGDGIMISDGGETLNMLFLNGLSVEKNKTLYREAKRVVSSHGVELRHSEIYIITDEKNLGRASQSILAAIQAVAYFIYKRRNIEHATFDDEVEKLFISNEVKYDYNYQIHGKANSHKIKFHVNSGKNLLVEPVSAATVQGARNKAKLVAFKWIDIRAVSPAMRFISVIDDREDKWNTLWSDDEAKNSIFTYSDEVIKWTSEQDKLVKILV